MMARRSVRSERFLTALADWERIVVITHDNPDPDAVAAGWALVWLAEQKLSRRPRLLAGGDIIRAENLHMVRTLGPPIELVVEAGCVEPTAGVLVDCGIAGSNHLLLSGAIEPVAVVDHHETDGQRPRVAFCDIRPQVAASASIAASYLREQKLVPGAELATAIVYAIQTEVRGSHTHYSRLDRAILSWLADRADPERLAEIEAAPLPVEYYSDLVLALESAELYGETAFCLLPQAHSAEIVGEVADLLIRCEVVRRAFCGAVVRSDLVLSVRTEAEGDNAAELVQRTVEGWGTGGGHLRRAGGKIAGIASGPGVPAELGRRLRQRWLDVCRADPRRRARLIGRYEIGENL